MVTRKFTRHKMKFARFCPRNVITLAIIVIASLSLLLTFFPQCRTSSPAHSGVQPEQHPTNDVRAEKVVFLRHESLLNGPATTTTWLQNGRVSASNALGPSSPPRSPVRHVGRVRATDVVSPRPSVPITNATPRSFAECMIQRDKAPILTREHCLQNSTIAYFQQGTYGQCFIAGTLKTSNVTGCICGPGWRGDMCNIPQMVTQSNYPSEYGIAARLVPRRVIYAFPFFNEFELLETRLHELRDAVDVYVIGESIYTAFGEPNELRLLQRMRGGYLREFQDRIVYVKLDRYAKNGRTDGWEEEELLRAYIGHQVFTRVVGLRDDDIFVLTDADELPARETLIFSKVHDGYPEPIGFHLRHTTFGFYWLSNSPHNTSHVFGACSVGMLKHVFAYNAYRIRRAPLAVLRAKPGVSLYRQKWGGRVVSWSFGSETSPAGWHCSWCFRPTDIRDKLLAAQVSDVPRWGSYPSKVKLDYIRNLTVHGVWFDGTSRLVKADPASQWYAPVYVLRNGAQYQHLLQLPTG